MTITEFDDIRPYRDDEVEAVLTRLTNNREFSSVIAGMASPRLNRIMPAVIQFFVRRTIQSKFRNIKTVRDFQSLIGENFEKLLLTAADGVTCSGIAELNPNKAYLFISNHRDIAMDPALVDLVLDRQSLDTVRIAIGDNLLSKPYTSDIMRVNKSFVVKRSVEGRREKLSALQTLSRYIRHSITVDNHSVWIAQREGRAKDGLDKTETALLKMLALSAEKGTPFDQSLAPLNIIPVAISYEFDPCDNDKGRELHAHREQGSYEKLEHEDLKSIYKGVVGYKGRVHIAFGNPVTAGVEDADTLAARIDREIISNYQAHPTNVLAYEKIYGEDTTSQQCRAQLTERNWSDITSRFQQHLAEIPDSYQDIVLAMYANPIKQKHQLSNS